MSQVSIPIILVFVSDLYFSPRIESAAEGMGFRVKLVEGAREIAPDAGESEEELGEHLEGQTGRLIEQVTAWQPALMIFDLNNGEVPWEQWIPVLKTSAATRRMPILAFGSHKDVGTIGRAKAVGADVVLARSAFVSDLPNLIQKYARVPNQVAIADGCAEALSELAREGIRLFNAGEYFEAHEVLEHAWSADTSAARELYRAILQVAVAYLQIERGNYRGAVKMFLRMRQWFAPLPEVCRGVDVAGLREAARAVEERLLALGEGRMGELDRGLFQPVRFV